MKEFVLGRLTGRKQSQARQLETHRIQQMILDLSFDDQALTHISVFHEKAIKAVMEPDSYGKGVLIAGATIADVLYELLKPHQFQAAFDKRLSDVEKFNLRARAIRTLPLAACAFRLARDASISSDDKLMLRTMSFLASMVGFEHLFWDHNSTANGRKIYQSRIQGNLERLENAAISDIPTILTQIDDRNDSAWVYRTELESDEHVRVPACLGMAFLLERMTYGDNDGVGSDQGTIYQLFNERIPQSLSKHHRVHALESLGILVDGSQLWRQQMQSLAGVQTVDELQQAEALAKTYMSLFNNFITSVAPIVVGAVEQ